MRTLPALAAVIGLSAAAVLGSSATSLAGQPKLSCSASMSNANPKDYTTTDVEVATGAKAHVKTVAAYKSKNTTHTATANSKGHATVPYYISGATPGYKVKVAVTVSSGSSTGHCSTSFTPQR